ncbi:MAG: alkaline phosphatase [Rikenellaceae bacterium]
MKKVSIFIALLLSMVASIQAQESPKSLIYMIGDGMGAAQLTMLMSESGYAATQLDRAQNVVLTKSYSADALVTDSAAAGTALATGYKTNNGMLGRTPDGVDRESIMALASKEGKSTGFVVTCEVQHATPAAFYAHVDSRREYPAISTQLAQSSVDVAVGGGYNYFAQSDLDILKERGYSIVTTAESLDAHTQGRVVALLSPEKPLSITNGRDKEYLATSTAKAIELLSQNKEGFVLMIEGSQIDWEGHNNDVEAIYAELQDFERAIEVALDYADSSGDTLVVITADHETGGLALTKDVGAYLSAPGVRYQFTTGEHSGVLIPALLYGAGADRINGIVENSELAQKLIDVVLK